MTRKALLLTGSFGLGHEMLVRASRDLLTSSGWQTRTIDSVKLLGPRKGMIAEKAFNRLVNIPGLYDGLHFAHLRTGSKLADLMDWASTSSLVPALRAELDRDPVDLMWSVFATGASVAAKVSFADPRCRSVVLCTDVAVHRLWVSAGTDLFLVTSPAAAESVRRYVPRAHIAIVHPPVREEFYSAPSQQSARAALGISKDDVCVLMIDSGWGFAPFAQSATMLARAGVRVLAVAGHNDSLTRRLRSAATRTPGIISFGFTSHVPMLMAASDLVVTLPGATTCSEARVIGRPLLLLDVMPGHGRDNVLHELEQGNAHVCCTTSEGITKSVLALLEGVTHPATNVASPPRWQPGVVEALMQIGVDLRADQPSPGPPANGARRVMNGASV